MHSKTDENELRKIYISKKREQITDKLSLVG